MNVTAAIRAAAARSPNATAFIRADHSTIRYRDLERMIDAVCARAGELGLRPGHVVALGIAGPDELPGLLTALALARAGVATADLAIPPARVDAWIVEHVPAPPGPRAIKLRALWDGLALVGPARLHEDPGAVLRIMSSSATTGRPKHASVTHRLFATRLGAAAHDTVAHGPIRMITLGLGCAAGFRAVLAALAAGATIVLAKPSEAAAAIERHGVTGLLTTVRALRCVLQGIPAPVPRKLLLEVTGPPCPVPLRRLAQERLADGIVASAASMECGRLASGPMGDAPLVPMAIERGVEIRVMDCAGGLVPPGTTGTLQYRTPGIVPGYDDPALTDASFQAGWFLSGDVGHVKDGRLTLTSAAAALTPADTPIAHPAR